MRVKLLLLTLYLNGGLHAVSVGKPSEQMSNFWTIWFFFEKRIRIEFRFYAHPYCLSVMLTASVSGYFLYIAAVLVRCSR